MTQVQEDIISRLQVAITDWKAEVTASQEGLMQQIAGAAVQLDNLAGILTGRPTPSIEEPEHLNALARQLIDRDEIVEAQRGRIAEFESLLTELREEIEMLRPLDAQNQALNEELTVLRSSAETASRRLDEARAKIVSLEIETLEKAALADSQPSAEELQETVSALLQQLEDQEAQAQTVKDELTRQIETLQLESEAYLERLLEVQTRADTLEAELATRKADAERETAELRQTVVDLQGELGLLRQQEADSVGRDALVEELNRVRQEAETGVASLAEARVRITALEQELLERSRPPVPDPAVLEQAVERLEGELRTLRQCETARLDANESLAADLRRLQEELRAKERALAESRKEAQSLHAELTARPAVEDVSRIRELEELATALRGEVETLRFGKAQAIEANEALESEIAALKNALAECYASLVYPQTDPAQVAEGVHQIEMDLERLRAEAEQVSEVNRNLARELSLIQAKREVELQRNDAARDKIARLEQSLAARDAEVEAQVRRLAALENRVAELEPALQS
ncbi:MAG: hypothetical protein QG656_1954, partial [Candidatus Hydrogenedentes bacterium]|nr:hypothetical protein [Candidatus Hydrogenedentota bacterium]